MAHFFPSNSCDYQPTFRTTATPKSNSVSMPTIEGANGEVSATDRKTKDSMDVLNTCVAMNNSMPNQPTNIFFYVLLQHKHYIDEA